MIKAKTYNFLRGKKEGREKQNWKERRQTLR